MSTTVVETWAGADLSQIGPIYPMVGTEIILVLVGLAFWLLFHFLGTRIENSELEADDAAAHMPERLKRVFEDEARPRMD